MSVLLLVNHLGDAASTEQEAGISGSDVASGYSRTDLISGPRSTRCRLVKSAVERGVGFATGTNLTATHMIIARADWLLTTGQLRVRGRERDNVPTWGYISGVDYNPITTSHLIGPYSQDLITSFTQTKYRGFGITTESVIATSEATQISKLYFSNAFDFGTNPQSGVSWEPLPDKTYTRPLYGYIDYEIEAKITLTWSFVTTAKLTSFRALPKLLVWPLFLYDENADLWSYKSEHVIIENISTQLIANDSWQIAVTFNRLKHYT